jgi:hypothetical protein
MSKEHTVLRTITNIVINFDFSYFLINTKG